MGRHRYMLRWIGLRLPRPQGRDAGRAPKPLSFDCGQRRRKDLPFAGDCAQRMQVPHQVGDIHEAGWRLSGSSLAGDVAVPGGHCAEDRRRPWRQTERYDHAGDLQCDDRAPAVHEVGDALGRMAQDLA